MKTVIHTYHFYLNKPDEAAAWQALRDTLSATHPHCMESHGGAMHYMPALDGLTVELETACLFENQWNTAPIPGVSALGLRLFDWALDYNPHGNTTLKQGYYLEQTEEMRAIRRNVSKCGYCGAHAETGASEFCDKCLGSPHLKPEDFALLRMRPIAESGPDGGARAPLTDSERAAILPLYKDAQLHGRSDRDKARIAKARADIESKFKTETRNAKAEHDGMLWLMDRSIRTDNVIFYNHTGRFGFGWREPVNGSFLSDLLDLVSEFPFPYDIKCADGRTLSGG